MRRVSAVHRPLFSKVVRILNIDGVAQPTDVGSRVRIVLGVGVMPDEVQPVGVALFKAEHEGVVFAAACRRPVFDGEAAELSVGSQEGAAGYGGTAVGGIRLKKFRSTHRAHTRSRIKLAAEEGPERIRNL